MTHTRDIRRTFLDFFAANNHELISSSPIIQHNDPTLMFVNAGMVPFKYFFTGELQSEHKNVASCQKCIRAGGKHNDLENVGYTKRHHTFFEMLGNFSFGGYFKEQAIIMAWGFVTKILGIDPNKLLVTFYHTDSDAQRIWLKLLPPSKVVAVESSDNFWQMGDSGPCGPCSEIFYIGQDPEPLEIWNLVFMQYYDDGSGNLSDLPRPCIDTGMGLERLLSVVEGVGDNYKTSLFKPLIKASMELSQDPDNQIAHRVVVDHLRSSAFLIADGLLPGNTGRGYVLRRIIRRAMRYAYKIGAEDSPRFLSQLVPELCNLMSGHYQELARAKTLIIKTLEEEEDKFWDTLGRGMSVLRKEMDAIVSGKILEGLLAFKLYDTYGFPLDLTQDIMREKGIAVDVEGFEKEMSAQRSRSAWQGSGEDFEESIWLALFDEFGVTKFMEIPDNLQSSVLALVKENGELVKSCVEPGENVAVVLDKSIFYAESGGQLGDKGRILGAQSVLAVEDTQKAAEGLLIHHCKLLEGVLSVGEAVRLELDRERREGLSIHHSATHLLHGALRKILGESVAQKGSLVAPDYLRFDFSYGKAIGKSDLRAVEEEVRNAIAGANQVLTEVLDREFAMGRGAMALFGEKYGKDVRVITMGDSVEFCGGTHVDNTSDIQLFKIVDEGSVGSGLRRIKALAGPSAWYHMVDTVHCLESQLMQTQDEVSKVKKRAEKDKEGLYTRIFNLTASEDYHLEKYGADLIFKELASFPIQYLRSAVSQSSSKEHSKAVLVVGARYEQKTLLMVAVGKDVKDCFSAKAILKDAIKGLTAEGGGSDAIAQSGGWKWSDFEHIKAEIIKLIV